MKKEFLALILLLSAISCGRQDSHIVQKDGSVKVMVSASIAELYTRAEPDETIVADRCILEIYNLDGTPYDGKQYISLPNTSGLFNFETTLLSGHGYKLVFWADKSDDTDGGDLYYDTSGGLRNISLLSSNIRGCDIGQDAYYAVAELAADRPEAVSTQLYRAVSRINVNTGFVPAASGMYKTNVEFTGVPVVFDALAGTVSGSGPLTCSADMELDIAAGPLQWYVYLLAPAGSGDRTVDFDMDVTSADEPSTPVFEYNFRNIPIQRNFRTNIDVGSSGQE